MYYGSTYSPWTSSSLNSRRPNYSYRTPLFSYGGKTYNYSSNKIPIDGFKARSLTNSIARRLLNNRDANGNPAPIDPGSVLGPLLQSFNSEDLHHKYVTPRGAEALIGTRFQPQSMVIMRKPSILAKWNNYALYQHLNGRTPVNMNTVDMNHVESKMIAYQNRMKRADEAIARADKVLRGEYVHTQKTDPSSWANQPHIIARARHFNNIHRTKEAKLAQEREARKLPDGFRFINRRGELFVVSEASGLGVNFGKDTSIKTFQGMNPIELRSILISGKIPSETLVSRSSRGSTRSLDFDSMKKVSIA